MWSQNNKKKVKGYQITLHQASGCVGCIICMIMHEHLTQVCTANRANTGIGYWGNRSLLDVGGGTEKQSTCFVFPGFIEFHVTKRFFSILILTLEAGCWHIL